MNNSLELTALRPIFLIGRMSTWSRSRSVRNREFRRLASRFSTFAALGPGQQQDLLGLQGLEIHTLAVDHIVVAVAAGEGGDARGVQARRRFGDTEADMQVPVDDAGQRFGFISSEPYTTTGCMPKIDMWMALAAFIRRRSRPPPRPGWWPR
jgi:hypothetical protein